MVGKRKATDVIELPELRQEQVSITLRGTSPLIVHRFSEKARKQMLDKQTGKAKAGKEAKDPQADYEASLYRLPNGRCGFPAIAFKAAAVSAANDAGIQKVLARRAFHITGGELVPIKGEPRMREDVVRLNGMKADIRHRGEFPEWEVTIDVIYNKGVISLEQLVNLFRIAGFGVGVGEWRPERNGVFGTWEIATVQKR